MNKPSRFALYLAVFSALSSSLCALPPTQATETPPPTPTSTPTATPSPDSSFTAPSGSGFNTSSQGSGFGSSASASMPLGGMGSSLSQQILTTVLASLTQQIVGQAGTQAGIPASGMGGMGGMGGQGGYGNYGNKAAFGQSGQIGPDGFQMPQLCTTGSKNRSRFQQELANDPALASELLKLCVREVGSQGTGAQIAVFETLFNRAQAEGNSINRAIHNGYYEPMNKGTVDSAPTSGSAFQQCQTSLQTALGGSNTIGCRRHNATTPDYARSYGADPNSIVVIGTEAFYSKPGERCDENFC